MEVYNKSKNRNLDYEFNYIPKLSEEININNISFIVTEISFEYGQLKKIIVENKDEFIKKRTIFL